MSFARTPLRIFFRNPVPLLPVTVENRVQGLTMLGPADIRSMFRSELGRKSSIYFTALLVNAVLGIVVYGVLARAMDVPEFGTYTFILAFFVFTAMFFDFGIAPAGKRIVAITDDPGRMERRIGALLLLSLVVGMLYAVFVAAASFAVEAWFHAGAGAVLLVVSPLAIVFHLQETILSVTQGSSRMMLLSAFLVLPRGILILFLIVLAASGEIDIRLAVTATLLATGAAVGITAGMLRPSFHGVREEVGLIFREVREFGREMYVGRLVDGLTSGLDKILISFFHGMAPVGFYSVAMTMSTPVSMFSNAVSQSAYRRFVHAERIPRNILLVTLLWSTVGAALLFVACQTLIPLFFTDRYATALSVLPWVIAGFALAGLNHPFHTFLAARRQGRAIRLMSITCAAVNLVLNLVLIPLLGMTGAAIAFFATYAVNIVMNVHFYRHMQLQGGVQGHPEESANG
jgi:O-antigen/teichoic acid export membrane protein